MGRDGDHDRETRGDAERAAAATGARQRAARRALVAALDGLLDEGITDYSARTRASRRRMAALYAGFVHAEELLAALGRRGRGALGPAAAVEALARVLRHLLYWATIDGTEDPSAATRAALADVRRALAGATGDGAPAHSPPLLDCERCGTPGAELPGAARGDAVCGSCARRGQRLRAV